MLTITTDRGRTLEPVVREVAGRALMLPETKFKMGRSIAVNLVNPIAP